MEAVYEYRSPLGKIVLAGEREALTGLWFDGQKYFGSTLGTGAVKSSLPIFEQAVKWLELYFGGKEPAFTPALSFRGTPFQKRVWEFLLTIPYGQTITYGEIAEGLSGEGGGHSKTSARAVGSAVGRNLISLIVPCHRVVGAGGGLTGYAGGIDKKEKLLLLEKADLSRASCGNLKNLL